MNEPVILGQPRPIPEGWEFLTSGTLREGDRLASIDGRGKFRWEEVEEEEIGDSIDAEFPAIRKVQG